MGLRYWHSKKEALTKLILLAIEYRYSVQPDEIITAEGGPHIIKDKLVESVAEHMDAGDTPLFINREECELITAFREIDPISRKEKGNTWKNYKNIDKGSWRNVSKNT